MSNLITTAQLVELPFDTFLVDPDKGETVMLYGKTPQGDGGYLIELEYADAGGGRYDVQVTPQEMNQPMWDHDAKDC